MNPAEQAEATVRWLAALPVDPEPAFIEKVAGRISSSGAEQYYDPETNTMGFERRSVSSVLDMAEEEALDLAAYAWMAEHQGAEYGSTLAGFALAAYLWIGRMREMDEILAELRRPADDPRVKPCTCTRDGEGYHERRGCPTHG